MDETTAKRLAALNTEFYRQAAPSFSASRHNSWPGWETVVDCMEHNLPKCLPGHGSPSSRNHAPESEESLSVFDLACGNMRFEAYLEHKMPNRTWSFYAADNCDAFDLMPTRTPVSFQRIDVMEALMEGTLESELTAPPCMMTACIAFMHHVPSESLRKRLLRILARRTMPGGLIVVSLWCFLGDIGLARTAEESTQRGIAEFGLFDLEPGDCLLGWQKDGRSWRYCHSFTETEADGLANCIEPDARLVRNFYADGRNGRMNNYLVFQRR